MTMVLTELRRGGIVMAADTALTDSLGLGAKTYRRVLHGVEKLQPHCGCRAGIACYGANQLVTKKHDLIPIDFFLKYFIDQAAQVSDVDALSSALVKALNDQADFEETSELGFDIAALVPTAESVQPVVKRISNSKPPDPLKFTGGFQVWDHREQYAYDEAQDHAPIVSGDYNVERWITELGRPLHELIDLGQPHQMTPHEELIERATRWAALVGLVGELYVNREHERSVSPAVSTLVIPNIGDMIFRSPAGIV